MKYVSLYIIILLIGCGSEKQNSPIEYSIGSFGYDFNFLSQYQKDLILLSQDSSLVLVSPGLQGRILTSSTSGMSGKSHGWINYSLFESGKFQEHINVFGGEDRFWMGPEGGQYSLFFEKGAEFVFENWFTPASLDTEPFELVMKEKKSVVFHKSFSLTNYSGTNFLLSLNRKIDLLSGKEIGELLQISLNGVKVVGFLSENEIENLNDFEWTRKTGMPSIWILGMFNPAEGTVVFAPYNNENEGRNIVTDDYFGRVSPDRLLTKDNMVLFKADGKERGKIGLKYGFAKDIIGSYSPASNQLTLVKYSLPKERTDYVNSLWKFQAEPFSGDVVNAYNDGPVNGGEALGGFYELESSSPAANLKPRESLIHKHYTVHIEGSKEKLNQIAYALFQVPLDSIFIP